MYNYKGALLGKIKSYELNYPSIMVEIPKKLKIYNCSITHELTCVRTLGSFGNYTTKIKDKTTGIDIEIKPHQLLFNPENSLQSFSIKLIVDRKRYGGDLFVKHLVWKKEYHKVTTQKSCI